MKVAVTGAGAIGRWLTSGFIAAGAEATVLARGASLRVLSRAGLVQMLDDDGVRGLAVAMMREMPARGEKIGLHGFDAIDDRIATTRKLGAFRTAMLQDVKAGRALALDPIPGALVELARRLAGTTPTMDGIYGLTRLQAQNLSEQAATR